MKVTYFTSIDLSAIVSFSFPNRSFIKMSLESDDDILFDNDDSTDDSEHATNSKTLFIEHQKKPSNTRKNTFEKNFFS